MEGRLVAGRYRLIRPLGRGGMGAVWLGEDQLAGRQVAVKELRPPAGVSEAEQDVFRRRALAEARSAARLTHPNAVTLYDVIPASPADDAVYLIMEYVDGATLAQVIEREGPLSEPRAAGVALQMLSILDAAHALGIVHRDIKPANIMITAAGQVKLADFGIAHMVGGTRLTGSGVIGTPAYMAPEQLQGLDITPAVDLWALGATLYDAVAGRNPFDRQTTAATFHAILMADLPPAPCGPPLAPVITGLLVRDPAQRMSTQQARALLTGPAVPPPGPPTRPGQARAPGPGPRGRRHQPGERVGPWPRGTPVATGPTGPPPGQPGRRRRRAVLAGAGAVVVVAAAAVIAVTLLHGSGGNGTATSGSSAGRLAKRIDGNRRHSGQLGARQLGARQLGARQLGPRQLGHGRRLSAVRRPGGLPRPLARHDHREQRPPGPADGRPQAHRRLSERDRGHVQLHQRRLRVQPPPGQLEYDPRSSCRRRSPRAPASPTTPSSPSRTASSPRTST